MPRFVIEGGPGAAAGAELEIDDRAKLGRGETCEIRLDDANASREHAAIRFVRGRYYILDLRSRNGTFVNGARVKQAGLKDGDRVRIGDTVLVYRDADGSAKLEAVALASDEVTSYVREASGANPPVSDQEMEATPRPAAAAADPRRADRAKALDLEDRTKFAAALAAEKEASAARQGTTDAILFAVLLVLVFLVASFATQVLLRLGG